MAERQTGIARQIAQLGDSGVVVLGQAPTGVVRAWALDDDSFDVVLTGKQRAHYLQRHAEMAAYEASLPLAISEPSEVHRNRADPQMAIFYRRVDERHYLRVAVAMQRQKQWRKHSVLSYRIAGLAEVVEGRGRAVWSAAEGELSGGSANSHISSDHQGV